MRKGTGFVSLADLPSDAEEEDCLCLFLAVVKCLRFAKPAGIDVQNRKELVRRGISRAQDERGVTFDVSNEAKAVSSWVMPDFQTIQSIACS